MFAVAAFDSPNSRVTEAPFAVQLDKSLAASQRLPSFSKRGPLTLLIYRMLTA